MNPPGLQPLIGSFRKCIEVITTKEQCASYEFANYIVSAIRKVFFFHALGRNPKTHRCVAYIHTQKFEVNCETQKPAE